MFHLRASVALGRGKSPARAGRIALIKLRRVARPWALGGRDASPVRPTAPPLTTAGSRTSHARPVRRAWPPRRAGGAPGLN